MHSSQCANLSLDFLAKVTGRGYQKVGFSAFLRAITITEWAIAIACSVDPISYATSDLLCSSSICSCYCAQTGQFSNSYTDPVCSLGG